MLPIILYIIGTLLNSYSFIFEKNILLSSYYDVFLTSRNGVFFAFPLLCTGYLCGIIHFRKGLLSAAIGLIATFSFYCLEVYFVGNLASQDTDTSMYLTLPIVIFFLIKLLLELNTKICTISEKLSRRAAFWRFASTVIYVVQWYCQ